MRRGARTPPSATDPLKFDSGAPVAIAQPGPISTVADIRRGITPEQHDQRHPLLQTDFHLSLLAPRQDNVHPKWLIGQCAGLSNSVGDHRPWPPGADNATTTGIRYGRGQLRPCEPAHSDREDREF